MRLSESRLRHIIRQELNEAISKRIRMVSADVVGLYFACKELGYGDEESGYGVMKNLVREFANENYPELKLSFFDADEVHFEGADQFLVEGSEDSLPGFVEGIKKILFNFIAEDKGRAEAKKAVDGIRLHDTIHDLEDYKTSTPAPAAAPKSDQRGAKIGASDEEIYSVVERFITPIGQRAWKEGAGLEFSEMSQGGDARGERKKYPHWKDSDFLKVINYVSHAL